MLMQLGTVQFAIAPINAEEISHVGTASFAEHGVLGAMPPLEFTGEGPESWTIQGEMFPKRFGGLTELGELHAMRQSGKPQFLMRGDGVPLGWVVILRVTDRASYLSRDGVGRHIRFDVSIKRSQAPSADGIFDAMVSLFA